MGGKHVSVSKSDLQKQITKFETENTFANQSQLFQALANSEWGKNLGISAACITGKVRKFGITLKTQKGKKGGGLAAARESGVPRQSRADKFKADKNYDEWFKSLSRSIKRIHPTKYDKLLERAANGSYPSVISLNCIDCTQGQNIEIKMCQCFNCPQFMLRPLKENSGENEEIDSGDENLEKS